MGPRITPGSRARKPLAFPYAASFCATEPVTLRTANENITREMPLKIMLIPTNVPIAQAELVAHCA
jgi:hypothetical protein